MGGFTETEKMKRHVEPCDQSKIAHLAPGGTDYVACCDEYAEMFENVIDFESGDDIGYWLTEKMVAKLVDPYSKARGTKPTTHRQRMNMGSLTLAGPTPRS
jgi:hypothetical protein